MNVELWIYELNQVNLLVHVNMLVQLVSFRNRVKRKHCSLATLLLLCDLYWALGKAQRRRDNSYEEIV